MAVTKNEPNVTQQHNNIQKQLEEICSRLTRDQEAKIKDLVEKLDYEPNKIHGFSRKKLYLPLSCALMLFYKK